MCHCIFNRILTQVELSLEDELVVVLGGEGLAWINGHTQPVSTGDVIGFPAGTGDAHVFINDSNSEDALAGQDLAMWIWGENKRKTGDRVFYPLLPDRVQENKWTGELVVILYTNQIGVILKASESSHHQTVQNVNWVRFARGIWLPNFADPVFIGNRTSPRSSLTSCWIIVIMWTVPCPSTHGVLDS